MKTIILAGGLGTRLAEETGIRPKPMVEIGGRPIIWHIMNIYASQGYGEFLVACGYKGEMIKEYFANFFIHNSDFFVDQRTGSRKIIGNNSTQWVTGIIDTGQKSMTGGRILRLKELIGNETFMVTYGDGLCDINIDKLLKFHRSHGKAATVTAVHPPSRFGAMHLDADKVSEFSEKPQEGWINGGFFVFEPTIFDLLQDDTTILEREPLEKLTSQNELMAYRHTGFWQPMDTLREKQILEDFWATGSPPWERIK
ncbi:glucose-1-phosphate cytidylyltransferase [Cycloclasticus sp.]|jgi:glucose-1-phosphate cytidylyltransferase|uniref:glucose-1-phosphate cytidylyltransferase n=1 Tax=Cycloclasticus sp. TaxID=2024830 RepID=UPI000C0E5702|nr:glucose-1-phosphate cytidylyltransferase [Cycloclasticus sp.]PHR49478.1 MAG: glucose-1-phosphate cytidylyltransferase [Cycloclasticus sp.]